MPIRSGLFLPLFDELADPALVARLAVAAEEAATWWLVEFPAEGVTADLVRAVIRNGPAVRS